MHRVVFFLFFLALSLSIVCLASAEKKEEKADPIFGEKGEYNVSVNGAGIVVHREYDADGKPKRGEGAAGKQPAVQAVGRGFHKQRRLERRKRRLESRK